MFLWITATSALCIGLLINQFRDKPVALVYQSKEQRLMQAVQNIKNNQPVAEDDDGIQLPEILTLEQMRVVVKKEQALVLDARPEIFYRSGHIPTAVSLPREDFEISYAKLKEQLEQNKNQPIVIYCSSESCEDSQMVKSALGQLGYSNVALFKGGWAEWSKGELNEDIL